MLKQKMAELAKRGKETLTALREMPESLDIHHETCCLLADEFDVLSGEGAFPDWLMYVVSGLMKDD